MKKIIVGMIVFFCLVSGFLGGLIIKNIEVSDLNKRLEQITDEQEYKNNQEEIIKELETKNAVMLKKIVDDKKELNALMEENKIQSEQIKKDLIDLTAQIEATKDGELKIELESQRAQKAEEQVKLNLDLIEYEAKEIELLNLKLEKLEIISYISNNEIFDLIYDFENKQIITKGIKEGVTDLPETLIIGEEVMINGILYTNGTTTITSTMFGDLEGVKNIIIQEGTEVIEDDAFALNEIESLDLPDSLKKIGDRSFYSNQIKEVVFGANLEEIQFGAFGKNKITNLQLPTGLKTIGQSAFSRNEITKLVIPESVIKIGDTAFSSNSNLLEVTINSGNLNGISSSAFDSSVIFYNKFKQEIK